jgi:hypothetical protein
MGDSFGTRLKSKNLGKRYIENYKGITVHEKVREEQRGERLGERGKEDTHKYLETQGRKDRAKRRRERCRERK